MKLSLDYLKECLEYSEESPSGAVWKDRPRSHFGSDKAHKIYNVNTRGTNAGSIGTDCKGYQKWHTTLHKKSVAIHRFIYESLVSEIPLGMEVDHKDGNSLNNRIENLRISSKSQNICNSKRRGDNSTGYKGVHKHHAAYRAKIQIDGKSVYLGRFADPEEAFAAYCKAAKEHYGEFFRPA